MRSPNIDAFRPKIEELVVRSGGRIRAEKVHERLVAMGFAGSNRTTRRAVEEARVGASLGGPDRTTGRIDARKALLVWSSHQRTLISP